MTDNPPSGLLGQRATTSGVDPADLADQVAREEISRHYAGKVTAARTKLEKTTADLQRALDAAEAARTAWEQHQEITSSAAYGEPRAADLVEAEVLSLLLGIDGPLIEAALQAETNAPHNHQLWDDMREADRRNAAVKHWLVTHGHADNPRLRHALGTDAHTQLTNPNGANHA